MGDEQRLSPDEQLQFAREQLESGEDFTVAVEEEFALLDPATHDLVNRFEDVKAASVGTTVEPHLVGELIASEVEVKTGRCGSFAEVPALMAERRAQLAAIVEPLGLALCAAGTHPWADWKQQRIIDTPHYRRNDELLRYVVWRNNTFGFHVHVGIRGADRAIAVHNGLRAFLPELLALSASSPFVENVVTGLHSARTQIFTRFFPRCGVPDWYDGWDGFERYVRFLYETRSMTEHTQLWWSIRPHLAFPTVEIRISDGQPELRRGAVARGAVGFPGGPDRACGQRGRADRAPSSPADRGEHLACDPLRPRRGADRPRPRRRPAGPRADRAAHRMGAARGGGDRRSAVPRGTWAKRRRASDCPLSRGLVAARDLCGAGCRNRVAGGRPRRLDRGRRPRSDT